MRSALRMFVVLGALAIAPTAYAATCPAASPTTIYVTPDGRPGYVPDCASAVTAQRFEQQTFDTLAPGTVLQLLPSTPGAKDVAYFEGQILLKTLERVTLRGGLAR